MKECNNCHASNLMTAEVCIECGTPLENGGRQLEKSPLLNEMESINAKLDSLISQTKSNQKVSILDVNMPFFSMVAFMIKWAVASIPAVIVLFILGIMLSSVFGTFLFSLFH